MLWLIIFDTNPQKTGVASCYAYEKQTWRASSNPHVNNCFFDQNKVFSNFLYEPWWKRTNFWFHEGLIYHIQFNMTRERRKLKSRNLTCFLMSAKVTGCDVTDRDCLVKFIRYWILTVNMEIFRLENTNLTLITV